MEENPTVRLHGSRFSRVDILSRPTSDGWYAEFRFRVISCRDGYRAERLGDSIVAGKDSVGDVNELDSVRM